MTHKHRRIFFHILHMFWAIEAHNHVEYNPPDPIQRNDQPELIPIADIIEVDPIRPRVLKQTSITNFFKR